MSDTYRYLHSAGWQLARRGSAAVVQAPLRAVRVARGRAGGARRGQQARAGPQPGAVVARQAAAGLPRHGTQAQH